jgi:hypothetical protein
VELQSKENEMSDKKCYGLKDPTTGFYDPETGLQVRREEVVQIDTEKRVGKLTLGMIRGGGLIEVNRQSKQQTPADDSDKAKGTKANK